MLIMASYSVAFCGDALQGYVGEWPASMWVVF